MRGLTRVAAAAAFVLSASVLLPTEPSLAGGRAQSRCAGDGCDAEASSTRALSRPGGKRKGGTRSPVSCSYYKLDIPPDAPIFRPDGSTVETDGTGRWIERVCVDARDIAMIEDRYPDRSDPIISTRALQEGIRAIERRPIYVRPKTAPDLIDEAKSRLQFPLLAPRFSPASPWTYVNYPTALWLDGDASPRSATAEVPGVRVTVSASLEEVRWETGDGAVEVCAGPGRAPDPRVPGDDGGCSHVWSWPSSGQPDSAYQVVATAFWRVTWTAEGAPGGGDLGLIPQRSAPVAVRVAEIQTLNIPPHR